MIEIPNPKRNRRARYPENWASEIRPSILARARHRCERCDAPDRAIVIRGEGEYAGLYVLPPLEVRSDIDGAPVSINPTRVVGRPVTIVLSIAHHSDLDPANCADANLWALCQQCHLRLDLGPHTHNAWLTRRARLSNRELFHLPERL